MSPRLLSLLSVLALLALAALPVRAAEPTPAIDLAEPQVHNDAGDSVPLVATDAELEALNALEELAAAEEQQMQAIEDEQAALGESNALTPHGKRCNSNKGTCMFKSTCKQNRVIAPNHCVGTSYCCMDVSGSAAFPQGSEGRCGDYASAAIIKRKNNAQQLVSVVAIKRDHLTNPAIFGKGETEADNTMLTTTACAYDILRREAARAGHRITINSAFRSYARQVYFWNCYQCKVKGGKSCCNNGNLAAKPGTSNHGTGIAFDLQLTSAAYNWMKANAEGLGWVRTVKSETWHWEYRPGTKQSAFFNL